MSQYYIVSEEMKKTKKRKQNFAANERLEELAKDIEDLKEKYKDNKFAVSILNQFSNMLKLTNTKNKGKKLFGWFKSIARKLQSNDASANSPNVVAGTRG